ncbi:MAG: MBL fold metallo-hydrolase [Acidobacteria bacterium]|nr:MBL fold metallo-hydrolase [Acidobacteriota bacterium]
MSLRLSSRVVCAAVFVVLELTAQVATALPAESTDAPNLAFQNGQWFDGQRFVPRTAYAVGGLLTFQRPARVDRVLDLGGRFVVPPYGEAHTHSLSSPADLDKQIQEYLWRGVFYVLVQDAATEVGPALLDKVHRSGSVDVSYTQGVVTPSWGMIPEFYVMLAGQGRFGNRRKLEELDTEVIFLVDDRQDLDRKFERLVAKNQDFIKVILGFSEEFEKRKANPAYKNVPGQGSGRPGLDPKLLPELVKRAHGRGKRVSVHVETAADLREAVRAGADMIAHLPGWQIGPAAGFTDASLDHWKITAEDARLAAKSGITVITTAAHDRENPDYEKFAAIHRHNLGLLRAAGARIALGSDGLEPASPVDPEALYVAEMGGFDNLAVLKVLTETTPKVVFPGRKIGALAEGYEASFLVLEGDPLKDLKQLNRIHLRVKGGAELKVDEPVHITTTHLGGTLYMLDGVVDQVGLSVGEDGILVVDPSYMEYADQVLAEIARLKPGKPRFVINTHWHHGFANEAFTPETILVAHSKARESYQRTNFMFNRNVPPKPPSAWPDVTFEDRLTLHFNGEPVELIYLPQAHTDSDIAVLFRRSNVLMTGDVFVPSIPWIDYASGGRLTGLVAGIDRLLSLAPKDAKIIPGHGRLSTYKDLEDFRDMLHETIAAVQAGIAAGKSLEEIQAVGVPARWKSWISVVPEGVFIENIHRGLKGKGS